MPLNRWFPRAVSVSVASRIGRLLMTLTRRESATETWLLVSMWAAAIVPTVMFAVAAVQSHRNAMAQAETEVEHAVAIAHEHALRVLQTHALAFDRVTEEIAGLSDEQVRRSHEEIQARLRQIVDRVPALRSLTVWAADGRLLVSSDRRATPGTANAAQRDFFRRAALPEGGYHFSEMPDTEDKTGQLLLVTHRRFDSTPRFTGVVSAAIRPAYFFDFYTELGRTQPGMAISLFLASGAVVTRMPLPAAPASQIAAAPPTGRMMQRVAAGDRAGLLTITSPVDHQQRLIAFRRISDTPLYTAASLSYDAVLAQWRSTLWLLGAFTFPMTLALVVVARVAWVRSRREYAVLRELNAEADKRLKAEAALRQAQKLEAMGHLTGGVAHDVNNLLMVVNNNAHLLERMRPGSDLATPIASIKRAVEAGSRLTRQLLAFSRRQAWRAEVIDLRQWLPSVVDLLRHTLTRPVRVTVDIAPDVLAIEVDAAELELALINLAINARDAMPQGGELRIAVANAPPERSPAQGEFVEIAVSDTGVGIAPEVLDRVFEPFFTTKDVGKGTGLGLSQVYGFCTQAGGTATVTSRQGAGTTVTMLLRSTRAAAGAAGAMGAIPPASGRVLMVEDNDEVAEATGALLTSIGYTVVRAGSAAHALRQLEADARFDVVLSDIVMGGGTDGLELALSLRRSHPQLPVLLMTGYTSRLDAAVGDGFAVIAKPCPPDQLAAALRRATRKKLAVS
ncbi:hybrid sensor histidine kinase/response regulator [Piscinibacter sp. XHJ-5]|uniref:hybrid sensor histidine kinase/response regulator n=1 Tax=Piscinibacter sp. XHJ-5 TaxID=3037797 RepID=UPI002452BA05|nr:hybrid sensor histidine kinase/response regulator [Piscinibacter sp. XHJ-5]